MGKYKDMFIKFMEKNDILFDDVDENRVSVGYIGDNLKQIKVFVTFDEDDYPAVDLVSWSIAGCPEGKFDKALAACNDANREYRWARFYVDNDNDVAVQIDAFIDDETCAEECMGLVKRLVSIIDEAYPSFMQAFWS